jgi:hypothetical protein
MNTRRFALIIGILFLAAGIMGFIPGLVSSPHPGDPHVTVHHNHGRLLGIFPVNTLHNIVHLLIGVWGLASFRRFTLARGFARGLAIFYGLLAVMGLFPNLNTTFGLIPIHGHDVWLHAGTALLAAYFGWVADRSYVERDVMVTDTGRTGD